MDIKGYLKEKKEKVESFFDTYFQNAFLPHVLRDSMVYSLTAGGKRIRPILAMASCEACGGNADAIVPYAATLEFIHTYSLIHDDLPAMDNDDLRRGKPTNHKVFGEAVAILAGDALLTEAFSILSDPSYCRSIPCENLLAVTREISRACGLQGMVAGQVQDMLSEDSEPDSETLEFIHRHKTGSLICASITFGPLICGSTREMLDALAAYGNNIGLAFQVIDDILDIEGETEVLGKPKGSDEHRKKMTYPRLYGIERSREIAQALVSDAVSSIRDFSSDAEPLREIAYYLLSRSH